MEIYKGFASMYNSFMRLPKEKWVKYITTLWKLHSTNPKLVLDLCCGIGCTTILLSSMGYDMIGVDISEDMLMIAKQNSVEKEQDVLFLQQDMRELSLYGTVDAVLCLCDSLNYIMTIEELESVFSLVANYLNPDGIFIFDVRTIYQYEKQLKNRTFSDLDDKGAYIWENTYDSESRINEYYVTFFQKQKKSHLYERFTECHYQKAHSYEEIENALIKANLTLLAKYSSFSLKCQTDKSSRVFYVVKSQKRVS